MSVAEEAKTRLIERARQRLQEVERLLAQHDDLLLERDRLKRMIGAAEPTGE